MLSLEPATVTKRRYPELFQSGETAYGVPIVDGQHPHEFVMEIAGRYDFRLNDKTRFFIYGGPVAEPALGPTPYPHRASASENPVAVLGHHQQDSTHVANSVITLGFAGGPVQLEASTFHGREPNENRWNIDRGKPDSFSSRITLGITKTLTGQFSAGRINNREALHPSEDTFRMTGSLAHTLRFSSGHIASTVVWGRNKDLPDRIFNAYTFESTMNFLRKNWVWTRIENVDREREEHPAGRVQAYTFGYERDLPFGPSSLNIGIGLQATVYSAQGDHPQAYIMFLRLRPKGNMAEHMRLMHQD
jgi:hypothetical protein